MVKGDSNRKNVIKNSRNHEQRNQTIEPNKCKNWTKRRGIENNSSKVREKVCRRYQQSMHSEDRL